MTSPLSAALTFASQSGGLARRIGTISSTNPLVVRLSTGALLPATGRLSSYTASVGHVVLVLVDDSGAAVVLGRIVNP